MEGKMTEEEAKQRRAAEEKRRKRLAAEIQEDFERRREERRSLENGWLLNMNFLSGNQYCDVSPYGEIEEEDKRFFWQSRRVFNHIAPTVDSRVAKLTRLRPVLHVRAFSDEERDVRAAKLATAILTGVREKIGLDGIAAKATLWSEVCGSAFYKVLWDGTGGRQVGADEFGAPVYEGEVSVEAVPPLRDLSRLPGHGGIERRAQPHPRPRRARRGDRREVRRERKGRGGVRDRARRVQRAVGGEESRGGLRGQQGCDEGRGDPHRAVFSAHGGGAGGEAGDRCGRRTFVRRAVALCQRREGERGDFPSSGRTACACPAPSSGAASSIGSSPCSGRTTPCATASTNFSTA